ncbi:MAG: TIM barrel protein [Planctomycetota bacterium]
MEERHQISRREALKLGATGAAAVAAVAAGAPAWAERKKIPIGVQLYCVRETIQKDIPGHFKALKDIGYEGVDFAGYYGKQAAELRKMLDDAGLKCCGTHTGLGTLQGDNLKATVEFNKTLGNKYLICPGMDGKTVQGWKDLAKLFTENAEKLKPEGMYTGYHAHGGDFKKLEDTTPWDVFFSNAGPDVQMQMDTGNCAGGGGDPVALLKKYPGRTRTIHMKEHGGGVIGEGKLPWKEILDLCETIANTEWYIVEEEGGGEKALDVLKRAHDNLRKMLAG